MARKTPVNITSFETEQQRTVTDLYDVINALEEQVERLQARIKELEANQT